MGKSRSIFSWHHWTGLIVGVFLLLMSLSGALLVFTDELEASADAPWAHVHNPSGAFSYDASLPAVRSRYPDWEIRSYGQPGPNEAIIYELRQKELRTRIYAHPVEGTLLHITEGAHKQFHKQLLLYHYTLFSGTPGKIAVFCIGMLFLISLLTGLYVYRRSFWKVVRFQVRIKRTTTRSLHSSLHRVVGVWSLVFNLLIVATGLATSGKVIQAALEPAPAAKATAPVPVSVDAARAAVHTQAPDFQIHSLRLRKGSNAIQFGGRYLSDPAYYGKYYSSFTVNGATGKVEGSLALREQSLSKRLLSFSGPLHFGNYGGLPVKLLYCFFGLTPALLSITGFVIWRRRGKQKARALSATTHRHPAGSQPVS